MSDPGLALERTLLSRRRTVLPFLTVAALALRGVVQDGPAAPALAVVLLAAVGAVLAVRGGPTSLTVVVVLLAVAACLL